MKRSAKIFRALSHRNPGQLGCDGTTLAEVLVGGAILAVIVVGTTIAFGTAAQIEGSLNGPKYMEAGSYAQDWLESLRNHVGADDTYFSSRAPGSGAVSGWLNDDPSTAPILRRYQVQSLDCDGDGTRGDCFKVSTRVCWNEPGTCP